MYAQIDKNTRYDLAGKVFAKFYLWHCIIGLTIEENVCILYHVTS